MSLLFLVFHAPHVPRAGPVGFHLASHIPGAAGKTTVLYKLKLGENVHTIPS